MTGSGGGGLGISPPHRVFKGVKTRCVVGATYLHYTADYIRVRGYELAIKWVICYNTNEVIEMEIYRVVNKVDGKCYVGMSYDALYRFKQHIRESRQERYRGRKISSAIKEYGVENFYFEILEITNDESREAYWIAHYNSVEEGYNHTVDGRGNSFNGWKTFIDEVNKADIKEIKRLRKKGHALRHISQTTNVRYKIVEKICRDVKKVPLQLDRTRIYVYKLSLDGNVIEKYKGTREASEKNGIRKKAIEKVLYEGKKTAGGFRWKKEPIDFVESI